jgi:hypothetical protein
VTNDDHVDTVVLLRRSGLPAARVRRRLLLRTPLWITERAGDPGETPPATQEHSPNDHAGDRQSKSPHDGLLVAPHLPAGRHRFKIALPTSVERTPRTSTKIATFGDHEDGAAAFVDVMTAYRASIIWCD